MDSGRPSYRPDSLRRRVRGEFFRALVPDRVILEEGTC